MGGQYILFFAAFAFFCAMVNAASYSSSCVWINQQLKCTSSIDENGNMAGGAAAVGSQGGQVATGAGNQDSYNFNQGQLIPGLGGNNLPGNGGYPNFQPNPGLGGNNLPGNGGYPNFQPNPGYGTSGSVFTGTGNFNAGFGPYGFNPAEFVRRFFQGSNPRK